MRKLGVSVFLIDYRGYGRSAGSPTGSGILLDAEAAYDYVVGTLGVPSSRLILIGESLGCGPALHLAARRPCAGVVVQSAFTSIGDMVATLVWFLPWARWLPRTRLPNLENVRRVAAPKLFIHSRADEVIPFWMGQKLFESASQPKEFWILDDVRHNDTFDDPAYSDRLGRFLDRALR
jgi:hypothetical protein